MSVRRVKAGTTDVSVVLRIVDSTDGTPETGVVFNSAGIDLQYRREGAASTAITEATLAALTTAHTDGGFLHIGNGNYRLDLPDAACAAGVAGVLVHGTVTGMVVFAPYIELPVNTEEDVYTRVGAPAGASVSADVAAVKVDTAAILVDTGTTLDARIPAALVAGRMDASVGAMALNTLTAAALAADAVTEIQSGLATPTNITAGTITTVTNVTAVSAGGITAASIATGAIDADALSLDAVNEIADAWLDRDMATGTDSGSPTVRTPRQAMRALRNKVSIAAGTATVTKEDDTTTSWTAAVTTTAGDPISSIDPASA